MRSAERRKMNVLEMKFLRILVGVTQMDRVINQEVHRRAGIERELAIRAEQKVLRWFGHVERMNEVRMAVRVLMTKVCGRAGTRETEDRLDGWCEGGLGQQRNDGGDCTSMHEKSERVESPVHM